ncbi:DUF1465 family protein [Aurantiacibacter spongiae]|uniref:DUF1465 family protein n=1 Tax=Aurantiacibacter spongiae TaxID=2488860 RepID=A0A3N5CRZ3_9SPHN|nr:DUF1465 family protein [Aurantiacibacter spongiae]RPF71923.1 DUF1465 family protein [Aurantiacibacter spongiae]
MSKPVTISPAIIETLYEEALVLAGASRAAFLRGEDDDDGTPGEISPAACDRRVAMSCEALRTTTRMMHAIAWLLNQRAYHSGQITEFQLRRHGRLPPAQPEGDPRQLAMLDGEMRALVDRTRALYARVERLDRAWRARFAMQPSAVHRLRDRLGTAFG